MPFSERATQTQQILLSQLGGSGRLTQMLGVKQAIGLECDAVLIGGEAFNAHRGGIHFRMAVKGKVNAEFTGATINHVAIILEGNDLYRLLFFYARGVSCKLVHHVGGVFADQLGEVFRDNTGLEIRPLRVRSI